MQGIECLWKYIATNIAKFTYLLSSRGRFSPVVVHLKSSCAKWEFSVSGIGSSWLFCWFYNYLIWIPNLFHNKYKNFIASHRCRTKEWGYDSVWHWQTSVKSSTDDMILEIVHEKIVWSQSMRGTVKNLFFKRNNWLQQHPNVQCFKFVAFNLVTSAKAFAGHRRLIETANSMN